jgi:hypothetical protein
MNSCDAGADHPFKGGIPSGGIFPRYLPAYSMWSPEEYILHYRNQMNGGGTVAGGINVFVLVCDFSSIRIAFLTPNSTPMAALFRIGQNSDRQKHKIGGYFSLVGTYAFNHLISRKYLAPSPRHKRDPFDSR